MNTPATEASRAHIVWTVCALDLILLAAGLIFALQTTFVYPFVGLPLAAAMAAVTGGVVVTRIPLSRSGWLLVAFGTAVALNFSLHHLTLYLTDRNIGGLVLSRVLIAAGIIAFMGMTLALPLLFLTFPDGHLPSARWRPVVDVLFAVVAVESIVTILVTRGIFDPAAFVRTLEPARATGVVLPDWAPVVLGVGDLLLLAIFVASGISLLVRLRRARDEHRRQIKWVVFAGIVASLLIPVDLVQSSDGAVSAAQHVAGVAGALALPLGFAIALVKYQLWDIDLVIRRSAIYGSLWLLITGAYVAVAAGLGLAAGTTFPVEVAIGLTVLTTLVFLPARRWLETKADRWVFGRTATPIEAVQGLGELLGTTDRPGEIAAQLARTAAGAIGLAWVEVALDGSLRITVGNANAGQETVLPIRRGEEVFGEIACLPHAGRRLSDGDIELLEALTSQAGLALAHIRLASRIVHAQETERRRIERDIHDGAQQELATLVAQLGLARAEVNSNAPTERILSEVQEEVQRILANLRKLSQGIHPSVLRDGGIAAVARDRCSRLPIEVSLDIDPDLRARRFPDDIEGAAYFFLSEALANVVKHSHSTDVTVRLGIASGDLRLDVSDTGVGIEDVGSMGTGLSGLSDRIEALGGTLAVSNRPERGVAVSATLPVPENLREPK